ncbi:MAG: ribonuclease Z [Saprospiraceae bacterium]|nr:ribonuclease Z [Saprospiraceae bacterium]
MPWDIHILGTNAAVPLPDRHPSAQALNTPEGIFLIDCGEGTQDRLSQFGVKRSRINHIFISHLHGDHLFGLPGLITSYSLFGRKDPLYLFGPPGLRRYLDTIYEITGIHLRYQCQVTELDTNKHYKILETENLRVYTLPLDHRIPTTGYLFKEKVAKRKIDGDAIAHWQVPYHQIEKLKNGADWEREDGSIIENDLLTVPGRPPLSFAYCSDTRYSPKLIPWIRGVDLLYHETTFGENLKDEARKRGHSTSVEAALIAKKAGVKELLIGHFSTRYKDPSVLLHEAKTIFENTILAQEGQVIEIISQQD